MLSVTIAVSTDSDSASFTGAISTVAEAAPIGIVTLPLSAVKSLPAVAVEGPQRRRSLTVPQQIGVAVVLEHGHPVPAGQGQHLGAAGQGQHRSGRVLHGGDGVDVLGSLPPGRQGVEPPAELTKYPARLDVTKIWSTGVGGGKKQMRLRLGLRLCTPPPSPAVSRPCIA